MPNRNTAEVMGHLGRDPETRVVGDGGRTVTKFSIATSNDYKDRRSGEWVKKDATWWNCEAWGELGEEIETSVMKGDALLVKGKVGLNTWQSKDGEDRTSLVLTVTEAYRPIYRRRDRGSYSAPAADTDVGGFDNFPGPDDFPDSDVPF